MTKSAKIPETWLRGDLIHTNYCIDNTEHNKRPKGKNIFMFYVISAVKWVHFKKQEAMVTNSPFEVASWICSFWWLRLVIKCKTLKSSSGLFVKLHFCICLSFLAVLKEYS